MLRFFYKWRYNRRQKASTYRPMDKKTMRHSAGRANFAHYLEQASAKNVRFDSYDRLRRRRKRLKAAAAVAFAAFVLWVVYESARASEIFRP